MMKAAFYLAVLLAALSTLPLESTGQDPVVCPQDLKVVAAQNGVATDDSDISVQGDIPLLLYCVTACDSSFQIEISCRTASGNHMRPSNSGSSMTMTYPPLDLESCKCTATALDGTVDGNLDDSVDSNSTSYPYTTQRAFHVIPVLTLALQPSVAASGAVVTVMEGTTELTLTCAIAGSTIPITYDILWLKDGLALNSEYYMIAFLTPIRREDGGNYTCMFLNGNALLSDSLLLSVTANENANYNTAVIAGSVCGSAIGFIIIIVVIIVIVRRCTRHADHVYADDEKPDKYGRF